LTTGGFLQNVPTGVQWVQGDVVNARFVESLWQHRRFDYVYHLAAYAAEGLSHFIRNYNYTVNLLGSINLINQAVKHEVECFVFTSSIAVYGRNQVPMREDLEPRRPNASQQRRGPLQLASLRAPARSGLLPAEKWSVMRFVCVREAPGYRFLYSILRSAAPLNLDQKQRSRASPKGLFEIQAQHLRDYRQNCRVASKSHDVIHALFRPGDSTSLYGVSHSAVSKIETVFDSALSVVEFARCFLRLANLPNFALDRLSRYEATLWRQAGRVLCALETLDRRKPQERMRGFPSWK
jgi:hypothetical protein